jgi:hypothetical protein
MNSIIMGSLCASPLTLEWLTGSLVAWLSIILPHPPQGNTGDRAIEKMDQEETEEHVGSLENGRLNLSIYMPEPVHTDKWAIGYNHHSKDLHQPSGPSS